MRDKIIIRGKGAYKTTKMPKVKKKKKVRENLDRGRSVNFGETNNALMAISMESTVGCWVMLRFGCIVLLTLLY